MAKKRGMGFRYSIGDAEIMTYSLAPTRGRRKRTSRQIRADKRAIALLVLLLAITLLGIAGAWLSVLPEISVSQTQPLNAADPFSIPFVVSNNGPLSVNSLNFTCVPINIETSHQSRVIPSGFRSESVPINKLEPGKKAGFPCTFRKVLGFWEFSPSQPMTMGNIDIFIEYRPAFVFWKITQQFQFATFPDRDHKLYWKPIRIPEYWRHSDDD
jgi:hypothetical protein